MGPVSRCDGLSRGRRTHRKVKTGCKACKDRHQKCDEKLPTCAGCTRHSTDCLYPFAKGGRPARPSQPTSDSSLVVEASPKTALSLSSSQDLNLDDLELLHQYLTYTCISTGQTPEVTAYVRVTQPQLGQRYPFVMRGILAMAATHLSRLRPTSRSHYALMAARHQSASLPDFRAALPHLNQDNCHALVFYAKSLLWCSFAADEDDQRCLALTRTHLLPPWFLLLHGSCQLVEAARSWIASGPHTLYSPDRRIFDISPSPDDHQIERTVNQILARTGPNSMCSLVFSTLREAFSRASLQHENTPLRNAMNTWAGSLPHAYISLLHEEEPWALVALAHFCVLVDRSETTWFTKGHAKPLLLSIVNRLDDSWRCCVEWPIRELDLADSM